MGASANLVDSEIKELVPLRSTITFFHAFESDIFISNTVVISHSVSLALEPIFEDTTAFQGIFLKLESTTLKVEGLTMKDLFSAYGNVFDMVHTKAIINGLNVSNIYITDRSHPIIYSESGSIEITNSIINKTSYTI